MPPDWVREAAVKSAEEVKSFVGTGVAFIARPGRFAREWAADQRTALNPLGVLATGAGVLASARALLDVVLGRPGAGGGLIESVADAVAPFVHYLFLGLICHLLLRRGSGRRLTDSLAMALFAGGGPGVLVPVVVYVAGVALWWTSGRPPVIHNGLLGSLPHLQQRVLLGVSYAGYALFLACLTLALRALHRAPLWRAVLATALAVLFAALLFGLRPVDVSFGTRLLLRFHPLHFDIWVD